MIRFFITCLLVTFVWAEGTVKVNVDRRKINEGDSVTLTVTATNINDDPDVNLPIMEDFKVVSGPSQSSSTNVQFINGKMTKNSTLTYTWTLIPIKTGQVSIPTLQVPDTMIVIGDKTIGARLPRPSPPVAVRPPAYYMNNREIFVK